MMKLIHSSRISGPNPVLEDSELVLGLVAPIGTNFARFKNIIDRVLSKFGYQTNLIKLSQCAQKFKLPNFDINGSNEYVRLNKLMHSGNELRLTAKKGEFLALSAAEAIRGTRKNGFQPKTAHLLRSLKHPDEVRAFRRIYGTGFFLIGVTAGEEERRLHLRDDLGCSESEVDQLFQRDEHEEDSRYIVSDGQNYGQRTRDTFQLADVFVPLDDEGQLERFLKLLFGCPFETPTRDEHSMFLAFSASLRSADLSRQVGAVITSKAGDLVATGANDVPRRGGGLYWPGEDDCRDYARGEDSNEAQRDKIVRDVLSRLKPTDEDAASWLEKGRQVLRGSPLMDITEYGRAVHAEMEALLSCARSGVSMIDATLYSTTFPCHNCAKHIIAAGIKKVVYVEPYPKSQAKELFADSIVLGVESPEAVNKRVEFTPFVGIGPRRFFDLFSMSMSSGTTVKRKASGKTIGWVPDQGVVRIPMLPNSYLDREELAGQELIAQSESPQEKKHD